MSRRCSRYYYKTFENEAEAYAAAFARNLNFNILFGPEIDCFYPPNSMESGISNLKSTGDNLTTFLKDLIIEKEYEAESEAEGKAEIKNINLNFIINENPDDCSDD